MAKIEITDPHSHIMNAANDLHDALLAAIDTRAPADTLQAIRDAQATLRKARRLTLDDFMTGAGATPHTPEVRASLAKAATRR